MSFVKTENLKYYCKQCPIYLNFLIKFNKLMNFKEFSEQNIQVFLQNYYSNSKFFLEKSSIFYKKN